MERQAPPVVAPGKRQLPVKRALVHADAHRGNFKRALQHRVPHQDIAVEVPVVIVGRTAVVRLAGFQLAADLHEKDRVVLAQNFVLALLGGLVRVHILQFLRGDEEHLAVKLCVQARERDAQRVVRLADSADDIAHGAF